MSTPKKRRLFYFTPEQERQFNLVTVPGTNVNSNVTVGETARKTGVQALNFLAQEAARKDAEIESRSDRKTVKRLTTIDERLRGEHGYSSYMGGETPMSGRDPLLGTIFDWTVGAKGIDALGKTALWNFAKYGPSNLFRGLARNYFVNNAFKLELRKPILFGVGETLQPQIKTRLGDAEIPLAISNTTSYRLEPGYGYRLVVKEPSTSLKFFERNPSRISEAESAGVTRLERNFTPRWHVAKYPGYLLKGLMGGSPLERQISKNGTISVNLLNAYFNKASQIEREIANKVLTEQFAGLKTIDYNLFKKAVLDELIGSYNRVPLTEWADYGIESLGFNTQIQLDAASIAYNPVTGNFEQVAPFKLFTPDYKLNTFTFESPRIPIGSSKHYDVTTLGHSRTFTPKDLPKKLYVMESLSDWGLSKAYNNGPYTGTSSYLNDINKYKEFIEGHKRLLAKMKANPSEYREGAIAKQEANIVHHEKVLENMLKGPNDLLIRHLHDNYLQRQLQENLRYAAENGLTKMRYPTSETAAKIEGYTRLSPSWELIEVLEKKYNRPEGYVDLGTRENFDFESLPEKEALELSRRFKVYEKWDESQLAKDFWKEFNNVGDYSPQYQTILKKYADFPKLFLKLYKGLEVRTVTDAKGNTWYEVDVPKGYLSREWQFKKGGKITINNIEI